MRGVRRDSGRLRKRRGLGLTLVEMLVVIGICGVLALLLVPVLLSSRAGARRVVCANNLGGLGQAYSVCLIESNNYLPNAYYAFDGKGLAAEVAFVPAETGGGTGLVPSEHRDALVCPSDKNPVQVAARTRSGAVMPVSSSYAYNIGLPLGFRNASRIAQPSNTVTFYDGDASAVLGAWEHSLGWASDTIRYRHREEANYLFLDGHVENSNGFPDRAFDGGAGWYALAGDMQGAGGGGDDWDGDSSDPTIDYTIDDGTVTPNESCTVTITCLGAAFQYGAGGPRIPVTAYYRLDGGSREEITDDVRGGEQVVLEDFEAGTSIGIVGKCTQYIRCTYESDDGAGHCWVMRDGDVVPSISGFAGQAAVESFLEPYMTDEGVLTLGPNDVIFLFELSDYIDYERYSCADFQDLVVLVTMSNGPAGACEPDEPEGSDIGGAININPNNNSRFEFEMVLPGGYTITRDDIHSDNPHHHAGEGFHPDYLEYTGPAVSVRVKPKGNGNQNSLTVDGAAYSLANKNRYLMTSDDMTVHLYNSKRNKQGKAMGKWWIEIDANDAEIEIFK